MNKRKLLENLKAISHCCGNEVKDIDRAGRRAYLIAAFARKDELLREAMESIRLSEWVHVENVQQDKTICNCEICDLIERIRKELEE